MHLGILSSASLGRPLKNCSYNLEPVGGDRNAVERPAWVRHITWRSRWKPAPRRRTYGEFDAFDARTGELLWQFPTGNGIHCSPIASSVNGKQ